MKLIPPLLGEIPLPCAPRVQIKPGVCCIPQHYLAYQHSLASVQHVLLDIDYEAAFPVFVDEQDGQIFIQVGIIGKDNYKQSEANAKIVYGRRWRVEPQLPTSEIIQTVFLALKTAREHEVRERFKLVNNGVVVTPLSNHHDLPLMASQPELVADPANSNCQYSTCEMSILRSWCTTLRYDNNFIEFVHCQRHSNGQWLFDFKLVSENIDLGCEGLPEVRSTLADGRVETLILDELSQNTLYFALMSKFLQWSDQHVEENFTYQGFARFSRRLNVARLGDLSKQTRAAALQESGFAHILIDNNYRTDKTRVPKLHPGPLATKIKKQLAEFDVQQGIWPEQTRLYGS